MYCFWLAIAAAVLGGCSLRGGEGSILGVIIGTALILVLRNVVTLVTNHSNIEFAIIGAVILAGVITVSASQELTAEKLVIALAYGAGTGAVVTGVVVTGGAGTAGPACAVAGTMAAATAAPASPTARPMRPVARGRRNMETP